MTGKKGQRTTRTTGMPNRYSETLTKELDGRYRVAKELKTRLDTLLADLGGEGALSAQKMVLCRRAVFIEVLLEGKERALVKGEKFDAGMYMQSVNTLLGLLRALGLKRQTREISLTDYLRKAKQEDRPDEN